MTLVLSEEHRMLQQAARDFFTDRQPVKALRALRDTRDPVGFDPALWRDMAGLGWTGILVPETYGGSEFGYQGLGQVLEEAGRTLAASPLVSTVLFAGPLIVAAGTDPQRSELLGAIARGERILTVALEEGFRHAPHHIALRAERADGGYVLTGEKTCVLDGHVADEVIVVARTTGAEDAREGLTLLRVAGESPGLTRTRRWLVDSRNMADLRFAGVRVGSEAVLGPVDGAWPLLERALDGARAGLAAEMLGSGLEAFERTLAYLKLRVQFDVPIGSFQALKHRAALMFCEIELARSAVRAALAALDAGRDDVPLLASLAKAKACEMLELVTNEAVQMHGGIGMTDAEEIGLFLKRARVAQQTFGDAVYHRDRYATIRGF
jgi:alkylation response protein AidB-like acyl-CoA dehydrogenase